MSFKEEYAKLRNERIATPSNNSKTSSGTTSFAEEYNNLRSKRSSNPSSSIGYIAPVSDRIASRMTVGKKKEEEKKKERKWFEKGLFEDGYDIGDVTRTILGSAVDALENVGSGIIGMGEKAVDSMAYIAPYAANGQFYQNGGIYTLEQQEQHEKVVEQSKKDLGKFIAKDLYDEEKIARAIISDPARKIGIDSEYHSVFGEKSDALIQSGGQLLATAGLAAAGLPWWATTGVTSFGSEAENAMNQGATYEQAGASAAISAGAEILSEKLSGGISFGGKTLDDALTKQLARGISNKLGRTAAKLGLDMAGEGAEEVFSQIASNVGSSLYKEENLKELLTSEEAMEEYLESFIGGAALGGVSNTFNAVKSNSKGVDYTSGLTANEDAVIRKVYNDRVAEAEKNGKVTEKQKSEIYDKVLSDMDKGYLSIDDIESALGGQTYEDYKRVSEWEDGLQKEFDELHAMKRGEMTGEQLDREAHLKEQLKNVKATSSRDALKSKLSEDVFGLVQGDRLIESYNERTRRGQAFEADLTKYDAKQQATIQKAIDSGILNNTNRTHEFVDIISKISADKGVLFDFTNNKKLKESGFAIDGKQVNGFVTKAGISINIDSPKAWQSTVGHEVTHVLEGTEFYTELQNTLFEYAKTKGEYDSRMKSLTELYKDVQDADINAELTADLVGEYLFTDENFIKNLSTQNRTVFQKIYDEIKYLYKAATGSKEAKELEKVKRAFDKAYKEAGGGLNDTKYSISSEGKELTKEQQEYFKDSKVRDENGSLKVMYHGTPNGDFTVFKDGTYFTDSKEYADKYQNPGASSISTGKEAKNPKTFEVYLDIKKPFDLGDAEARNIYINDYIKGGNAMGINPYLSDAEYDKIQTIDWTEGEDLREFLIENGYDYDGLVLDEGGTGGYGDEVQSRGKSYVVFSPEQVKNVDNLKPTADPDIRYSLSDSDGKQLTKEQQEYFKDSKMRDENGNLKVMYHGSQDAGFHIFDSSMSDDGTSFFFVDRNDVAASYSGTSETYEAKTIRSAEDMNNFLAEIGYDHYEAVEKDGMVELLENNEHVAYGDTAKDTYEIFCWYEGVGEGDANYKVYLNLKNPLEVDAEGRNWNRVSKEFSQDVYDMYQTLTAEEKEALIQLAAWEDFSIFRDEWEYAGLMMPGIEKSLISAYPKVSDADVYDLFSIASDGFSEESLKENANGWLNTRNYAQRAKEQGYDGVIFKNIVDVGGYGNGSEGAATVAIAFDSNQIKSVANAKPTADPDIRYSLSKEGEQFGKTGQFATPATELRYEAPVAEESSVVAPVAENSTVQPETQLTEENSTVTADDMSALFPNNAVPVQEELEQLLTERDQLYGALEIAVDRGSAAEVGKLAEEYEAINSRIKALESKEAERTGSITDADAPAEMDAPFYGESENVTVDDPFEERDWYSVGNQKVKAYMYENPEVKPFFQAEAQNLLGELSDTQKGERWYNDQLHYDSGGEKGFGGQKRLTSDSIATLLDDWGMSYADIEKGLNAIIEDNGAENIAAAKKIEFMLNDRLLNGYKDFYTNGRIEPNQEYIRLLNEKQISSYSQEAFDQFMANADQYAPTQEEYYAPMLNSDPRYEQTNPVYDLPGGQQTYVPTKATYDATPTDDVAPMFDATGKKGVPDGQQAFMPDAGVEVKRTRKEYHQSIIDRVKTIFKDKGFDFDNVLKNAKNLSTWSTVDNTPQRVMEKALGYKEGGILADITVNKVAQNETEGIKWLNAYVAQLKQISKQYGIKPGSKESAAAQMYAEGFYVNDNNEIVRYGYPELVQDFGDADVRRRIIGLARDARIRKIYDDTLGMINESRARNLYPEIPRLDNYFLHFRAMNDTFSTLGLPFNPNDIRAKDLPTDLNGVTADLKPGQPYFASANHRTGKRTSFDLLGGVERYLNSAKNQIYHIDDIQTLRALRNYIAETYGHATGLEDIDSMTDAEAEERIKQVYDSHLSTFAKFLNEEANVLAGKTALIDRGIEGIIGRRGITFLNALNKQVGSNMVGYNVSSSLTNFLPVAQAFAKTNKFDFTKAFVQTVANKLSGGRFDSFAENSPVVIRRKGEDRFTKTFWQKMADPGYALMGMVDDISTEVIARTKYNEFTRKGMDSQKAHFETDKWVSKLMGDRSLGQQPQLYNSKMLGLVTKFQLEVRNQLDSQFYDTIQETKVSNEHIKNELARNAKTAAKVTSVFAQLAVAQHLYGMAFESIAGYNPAFDIIEVLMTAFGYDDEEDSEDTLKDNLGQGFEALMEDLPYASIITGGGRIPISSALPIKEFFKGEDQYGNEKNRWETLGEVAPYYLMPGGYGQAKKTTQGLKMFSDDHPIAGSYTDAGNLRYPVEDTVGSRIKAGIFGQYASENAQKYFDQEQRTLNPEQTEIFAGLDIPIEEYWEYRDNLYEFYDVRDALKEVAFADDATDEDVLRYTYINNAYGNIYDLYDKQKEIASGNSKNKKSELRKLQDQMKQMLSESKYAVDSIKLTGAYGEVGDKRYNYDSGKDKWYEIKPKNADGTDNWYYQKEQEVTKGLGISYEEYWNNREEYNYAYDKPGRYAIAQAVGGYDTYMEHYDVLENWQSDSYLGADKDSKGNSISGSRKKKVVEYINGLDMDYGERIILYRTVYTSKADKRAYNQDIIDYLNERDDISYQEMKTILEELDMEVDSEGYITW